MMIEGKGKKRMELHKLVNVIVAELEREKMLEKRQKQMLGT